MKSKEELLQLYENELKPQLAGVEKDRKDIKKMRLLMIIGGIGAFLSWSAEVKYNWIAVIAFLIMLIYFGLKYSSKYSEYKKMFKSNVVRKIVKYINPDYTYKPNSRISAKDYNESGIYTTDFDRYSGDDLVTGVIDKTPFQFSDLHTEEKRETTDSNGNKTTKLVTIFQGIFFFAEFNKHLEDKTFVVPEKAHKNILGKEKKKIKAYGNLLKLENPEFEKIFSVYGSSQQEARYILTPTMMEAMVQVYKRFKLKMKFSFIGSNVYCAIPMNKNNFEPKISKSVKYSEIEEMVTLFSLIETIITEMNLNTRIWTKE